MAGSPRRWTRWRPRWSAVTRSTPASAARSPSSSTRPSAWCGTTSTPSTTSSSAHAAVRSLSSAPLPERSSRLFGRGFGPRRAGDNGAVHASGERFRMIPLLLILLLLALLFGGFFIFSLKVAIIVAVVLLVIA